MNFGEEEAGKFISLFKKELDKLCKDKELTDKSCYLEEALVCLVSEGEYDKKTDEVRYKLTLHTHACESESELSLE